MQQLPSGWPPFTNPYRHYICTHGGGRKETGELPADKSVGIVIPVRDGLPFFKLCFHSVLSFTDHPYMLHVVDHLGVLATKKYFAAMHNNHQVYLHQYDEDFNFAAEVNLGLREAFKLPQVKYGLILNADTVVSPCWLSSMVRVIESAPRVGIVGPLSNRAIMEQQDAVRRNDITVAQRVSGFCMLIKREVWEELEGFDEAFAGGGFEDWDFCERARRAGWHVLIDGFTHINHYWRGFRRADHDADMRANEAIFFKKHPLLADHVVRVGNDTDRENLKQPADLVK